jgi:hypothetical protein
VCGCVEARGLLWKKGEHMAALTFDQYPFLAELGLKESNHGVYYGGVCLRVLWRCVLACTMEVCACVYYGGVCLRACMAASVMMLGQASGLDTAPQ